MKIKKLAFISNKVYNSILFLKLDNKMITHRQLRKISKNLDNFGFENNISLEKRIHSDLQQSLNSAISQIVNSFEDEVIKLLDIKSSKRRTSEVLEVFIDDLNYFKEILLKKTFKISRKNEEDYNNQIILLEDEIVFKNRRTCKILNLNNLKEIYIQTDFVHSDKPNYKTTNENADIYFMTLIINQNNSEKMEFTIGYPRYINVQNTSYEICYDLKEIEDNILNIMLNHYQEYKENLSIHKKI